jgi:hypothetical protein
MLFFRPENGGQYCSGQSTRIQSCENNPVKPIDEYLIVNYFFFF